MKFTIGDYEIDIKAKSIWGDNNNYDADSAKSFMNMISCYARMAAASYENCGMHYSANSANKAAEQLYEQLAARGLYKDLGLYKEQ